jgi:hypothetical protein
MGKRLLVAVCAVIFISGCAAFDHDNTPYSGFEPDLIPVDNGANVGPNSGYYAGTMTAETNACQAVSDAVGDAVPLAIDVVQSNTTLSFTFADAMVTSGLIDEGGKTTFMVKIGETRHVYALTFADSKVSGSIDVIEANADSQFGTPCATYAVELTKGEKPQAAPAE